jgi:hypothetical protein
MMHGAPARVLAQHLGRNLRFKGSLRALRDFDPAYVSSGSTASNDQGGSSGYVGSTLKS